MRRVILVGIVVVLTVVMALPGVALVANNSGLTPTGRSADSSYGTAAKAEYNKKKVCVKHFTNSKKNPYRYIYISKKAYENGHKQHGDVIVNKRFCQRD